MSLFPMLDFSRSKMMNLYGQPLSPRFGLTRGGKPADAGTSTVMAVMASANSSCVYNCYISHDRRRLRSWGLCHIMPCLEVETTQHVQLLGFCRSNSSWKVRLARTSVCSDLRAALSERWIVTVYMPSLVWRMLAGPASEQEDEYYRQRHGRDDNTRFLR